MTTSPIAIFDSGLGGLTVLSAIRRLMPHESLLYFGDSARNPYGSKSADFVLDVTQQNIAFLESFHPRLIVVACNTASALALPRIQIKETMPLLGVIEPGARAAVAATSTKRVGVIGTEGTVDSNCYSKHIRGLAPDIEVFQRACPLFVPLVEEGRHSEDPLVFAIVKDYLIDLLDKNIDVLVLGCTHYPLLKPAIERFLGPKIKVIDSATETARSAQSMLLASDSKEGDGSLRFFVTDNENRFEVLASRFLSEPLPQAEFVDIASLYKKHESA